VVLVVVVAAAAAAAARVVVVVVIWAETHSAIYLFFAELLVLSSNFAALRGLSSSSCSCSCSSGSSFYMTCMLVNY